MVIEQRGDPEATPDDVAALLTARTKDADGNELGVFNENTRPTAAQVQVRIEIARSLVKGALGDIPESCLEGFETAVALRAALLTEAAFWPEQTDSNQSTFNRLRELYLEAWAGIQSCVAKGTAGDTAFELNVGAGVYPPWWWPPDWWQRNLEDPVWP